MQLELDWCVKHRFVMFAHTPPTTHTMTMASVALSCSHYGDMSVCFLYPLRDAVIRRQYNGSEEHLDAAI